MHVQNRWHSNMLRLSISGILRARQANVPAQQAMEVRKLATTAPAESILEDTNVSVSPSVPLPAIVTSKLASLQSDIVSTIFEKHSNSFSSVSLSSLATTNNFTKNLQDMAKYYFAQGGKLFRPKVSLLMSDACSQLAGLKANNDSVSLNQYRIAMVSEMIHTASLVHDDVIDESDQRRGQPTVNARWGNRQAVLVGDFILARATKVLCSIGEPPVISTMAEVVEDLVQGELMQLTIPSELDPSQRFQYYMTKTFYKTASLFANSCKSVAMLAGLSETHQQYAFDYGRHLGLGFQLVDDMLDYVASSAVLGKPSVNDLRQGLATCPALFAAYDYPELNTLINRRFQLEGDVERALNIVMSSTGLERTRELAKKHSLAAVSWAEKLPQGDNSRDCLIEIAIKQLDRDR